MPANQQHMQEGMSVNQRLHHANIIQNARSARVANNGFNVFSTDAVNDTLYRTTGGRGINKVYVVSIFDSDAGCSSQPFWVVERSTFGYCRTPLFAGKPGVKGWIQKQYTHTGKYIKALGEY
jgi:hypothetical protein